MRAYVDVASMQMDMEFGGSSGFNPNDPMVGSSNVMGAYTKPLDLKTPAIGITGIGLVLMLFVSAQARPIVMVLVICGYGALFSYYLSHWVLAKDEGTQEMREVSNPIREGAEGFLKIQYNSIARYAVVLSVIIFLSFTLRPSHSGSSGLGELGNTVLGFLGSISFVLGAVCSAAAGYISMWVSAQTNIRVASAARRGYGEALLICFRGGAFSAVLDLTHNHSINN